MKVKEAEEDRWYMQKVRIVRTTARRWNGRLQTAIGKITAI